MADDVDGPAAAVAGSALTIVLADPAEVDSGGKFNRIKKSPKNGEKTPPREKLKGNL